MVKENHCSTPKQYPFPRQVTKLLSQLPPTVQALTGVNLRESIKRLAESSKV